MPSFAEPLRATLEVHPDRHVAALATAQGLARRAREAVEARGRFSVALAGGTAPREAYALLAEEPFRSTIPWRGVHLFWGDERCVPPGHERSNFGMARAAFLDRVPIPAGNVHRIPGELPPARGAETYARELVSFFGGGVPRFDLVHLGVGPDAHTASLFPFADSLRERDRPVVAVVHPSSGEWRLSLSPPVLNAAARVEFLALGGGKAAVVRAVVRGALDPFRLPAQLVRPRDGELVWMLDAPAAAGLHERAG